MFILTSIAVMRSFHHRSLVSAFFFFMSVMMRTFRWFGLLDRIRSWGRCFSQCFCPLLGHRRCCCHFSRFIHSKYFLEIKAQLIWHDVTWSSQTNWQQDSEEHNQNSKRTHFCCQRTISGIRTRRRRRESRRGVSSFLEILISLLLSIRVNVYRGAGSQKEQS